MAESVGGIFYEVSADTSQLLSESAKAKTWLDRLVGLFGRADAASAKTERQMTQTARAVRQLADEASRTSPPLLTLNKLLAGIITARTVQAVIQMSDQYGQMASRIRNATSNTAEYEMVQARLLKTANGTYRALSEAQEVYLSVSDTLRSLGYSTAEVLDISDSLSYAFVRDAARSDQARTAMDAYSKALMKGKVEADGWASLMAATPSLVKGIAGATGESEEKIRKLGATGKLSLQALNEGLRQSLDENKRMADEMTVSVQDAGTKLRNALQLFIGKVNESSGASKTLTENVGLLSQALQDPRTIKAAQDFAGDIAEGFREIIVLTRDFVGALRWVEEKIGSLTTPSWLSDTATWIGGLLPGSDAIKRAKADAAEIDRLARRFPAQLADDQERRRQDRGFKPVIGKPVSAEAVDDSKKKETKRAFDEASEISRALAGALQALDQTDTAKIAAINAQLDELFKMRASGLGGGSEIDEAIKNLRDQLEQLTPAAKRARDAKKAIDDLLGIGPDSDFNKQLDQMQELGRRLAEGLISTDAYNDAMSKLDTGWRKTADGMVAKSNEAGDQIALALTSAAGKAITEWQGLGNLVVGVLKDMAQIGLSELVLKPGQSWLSNTLSNFSLTSFLGLPAAPGRANGGPVSAGGLYQINERGRPEVLSVGGAQYLMMGRNGGYVTPTDAGGAGSAMASDGPIIINQTLHVGAGVSRNEMAAAMEFTRQKTIADISEARRRGFQTGG